MLASWGEVLQLINMLRRLGNKKAIAKKIQIHFPREIVNYIEVFFGAGGMFFHKPKSKYNVVNDLDSDVFNLFQVISTRPKELKRAVWSMPLHEDLWNHWKENQETDPIRKAIRFLFLSNFGFMGKSGTMRFLSGNSKRLMYNSIDKTCELLFDVEFTNCDFRELFRKLSVRKSEKAKTFVYADPPYLSTTNNYVAGFTEQDSSDLLDELQGCGYKFAMSEFDHPFILEQARERRLHIIIIGARHNLGNRRTEILVTNYETTQLELFAR